MQNYCQENKTTGVFTHIFTYISQQSCPTRLPSLFLSSCRFCCRISHCSCKNFMTLSSFSRTFHDFLGPVGTLCMNPRNCAHWDKTPIFWKYRLTEKLKDGFQRPSVDVDVFASSACCDLDLWPPESPTESGGQGIKSPIFVEVILVFKANCSLRQSLKYCLFSWAD